MDAGEVFTVFLTVFIVVDPLGIVPVFISLTAGMPRPRRLATILKSVAIAFIRGIAQKEKEIMQV